MSTVNNNPDNRSNQETTTAKINFRRNGFQVVKSLILKWWLFCIVGLIAGIIGFFYAQAQKPAYESRLTFALDAGANDGGLSGAMSLAAQFGFGLGGGQTMFDGDNIIEILKSRRILENVLLSVDTFNNKSYTLAEYYIELNELRKIYDKRPATQNIHFPVGVSKISLNYLQDSILNSIYIALNKDNINAGRPDKKLSIYEVRIKSADEKFSKVFTDRLIYEAGIFYTEITSKKDRETLEILEQRVASLKSNVGSSIESRASSQDANVNPAFSAAQTLPMKQQYNMQAYGEAYKEMFKTLEMARYQYLKKIPLIQIIDHADYPMTKIKLSRLKLAIYFASIAMIMLAIVLTIIKNQSVKIEN